MRRRFIALFSQPKARFHFILTNFLSIFFYSGFDPTQDTPIELLHTILLGAVKYVWHISHTSWSAEQKEMYSLRLQATDTDGLSINSIRAKYIMQYANSLIGKQLKTIVQTSVFHVHDIVSADHLIAGRALGE